MTRELPYEAPDFNLVDDKGIMHSLDDYKGKWLILYFYIKDDTPGCTTEACDFRDAREDIMSLGAEVVGISKDDLGSHSRFRDKYKINFTLLSDPEHEVISKYEAWDEKGFMVGKTMRKTFIINPEGMVVKVYEDVTPQGHSSQIINNLKDFQKGL